MMIWQVGSNTVLYLAALKNVPQHLYEAASMDGASAWRRFKDVTLPMISPTLFFTFIILTIYGLQIFDQIYTAFYNPSNQNTSSDASLMYVIYLFQQAFVYFHLGLRVGTRMAALRLDHGRDDHPDHGQPPVRLLRRRCEVSAIGQPERAGAPDPAIPPGVARADRTGAAVVSARRRPSGRRSSSSSWRSSASSSSIRSSGCSARR